jgi:organic radical activating enzyme
MSKPYRVKAIWKTLQGEAGFAGRPAVFARFVGCNMWTGYEGDRGKGNAPCSRWCDTDFTKEGSRGYSAEELASDMAQAGGPIRFCVLTGGEPLLQVDAALVQALHAEGFFVAMETNGSIALRDACWDEGAGRIDGPDWIVCSPKTAEADLALEYFDELKLVVPDYRVEDHAAFVARQRDHAVAGAPYPLRWLQPEDGPRSGDATRLAIDMALRNPEWRVSVQTHKVLDVE